MKPCNKVGLKLRLKKDSIAFVAIIFLCVFLLCPSAYGGQNESKDKAGFDTTEALIDLLKQKGVINDEEALNFLERHKEKKAKTGKAFTIKHQEDQEIYLQEASKGITEKLTKDLNDLKDNYQFRSQDLIQKSILLQREIERLEEILTEEYKPQLQKSSWAQRIRFGGDIRLRHESVLFDKENATNIENPNSPGDFINSTQDEHHQKLRVRVFAKARLIDPSETNVGKVEAGIRIATGTVSNPVSTNYTLGHDNNDRADIVLDRAYLKWSFRPEEEIWGNKIPEISLTGGVMKNPWMSTSLLFDSDLAFEGVVLGLKSDTHTLNNWNSFFTLGYFPLEESEWNQSDKSLVAAQVGVKHRPVYGWEYKLSAAYYYYKNVTGETVEGSSGSLVNQRELSRMNPKYLQKGNSLFDMDLTVPSGVTTYGLLSEFKLLNLNFQLDNTLFFPTQIRFYGDWVKNLGYDSEEMAQKISSTKEFIESNSGDIGYQVGLKIGTMKPRQRWDWNTSIEYRYLESDAVLDAFTDSDFHLGGTNAKGFILGGELGLYENVWLSARWMTANEIDNLQKLDDQIDDLSVDTFQFNINAEF